MGEVIYPTFQPTADIRAPEMLRHIADSNPRHAFVIVWPEDGSLPTYHSSTGDVPTILMRLNEFSHKWYSGDFKKS